MYELIYTSAAVRLFNTGDLTDLLRTARTKNAARAVTGILLYNDGSFLQLLEGERVAVEQTYNVVSKDPRHHRIHVLQQGEIAARRFEQWSMGFVSLDAALMRNLTGRHALRSNGSLVDESDDVVALLDKFRSGQWHRYVTG